MQNCSYSSLLYPFRKFVHIILQTLRNIAVAPFSYLRSSGVSAADSYPECRQAPVGSEEIWGQHGAGGLGWRALSQGETSA